MDNIKDILKNVFGNIVQKRPQTNEKIDRVWQNVIEPHDCTHTSIIGIKDGLLSINTDTPARLYYLKLRRKKILEQLQEEIPEIQNIQFQIGKVK